MRDRTYAHRNNYDCNCYHLMCSAVRDRASYAASGYDCFIFSEIYNQHRQTVYYMAHKRVRPLTPEERYE
jgi:hypothetical protein